MYDIQIDAARNVVAVTLGGMMSVDEVADYIDALRSAFISHKLRSYTMLIDVSACPIQSQDMVAAMGRHMAGMPKATALAVVTGSSLARMQVRRLFTQSYARIVATRDDGFAWVRSGIEPPLDTLRMREASA